MSPRRAPEGISIREFARRDGCDPKLVRRAIEQGKLKTLADGKLNASLVGSEWRKTNRRGADEGGDKGGDTAAVSPPVGTGPRQPIDPDDVDLDKFDDFIENALAGSFVSLKKAEQIKENGLALKQLLDAKRKAGSLVEADTARQIIFEEARSSRDAWMAWPARVAPLIAADLGATTEAVLEVLTAHVHQQLADLGEPEPDFSQAEGSD